MSQVPPDIFDLCHNLLCVSGKEGFGEAFPQVTDCQWGRMQHIIRIKAVITQFVQDYFIGREIEDVLREKLLQAVDSK